MLLLTFWWIVLATAVLLIGVTKSGFGSGVGLLIVPLATIAGAHLPNVGERPILGLLLPLLIAGDLFALWQYRRAYSRAEIVALLPGTLLGVFTASLFLAWIHRQGADLTMAILQIEIGAESLLLVAISHWRGAGKSGDAASVSAPWKGWVTGWFAAISSTLAHAAGPIITLYLMPRKLDKQTFVGTCAVYFLLLNSLKVPAYIHGGLFVPGSFWLVGVLLPFLVVGAILGARLNRRVSDATFSRVVQIATLASGAYLLVQGVWRLSHL